MNRTLAYSVVGLASVGLLASPAMAKHKKPITKTYSVTAPTPDPTNYLNEVGAANYSVCNQVVPQSFHKEAFKAPEAGTLKVEMTGFTGDWDLLLLNGKGSEIGSGGASDLGSPATPAAEKTTIKIKKPDTISIIACNWAGGPTATVKYTFTYAK